MIQIDEQERIIICKHKAYLIINSHDLLKAPPICRVLYIDFITIGIYWRFSDTITLFLKRIIGELIPLNDFVD
jgi:hypothetical protein